MNLSVTVCSCYRNRPFFYRCRPVSAAPVRSKSHSGTAEQRNSGTQTGPVRHSFTARDIFRQARKHHSSCGPPHHSGPLRQWTGQAGAPGSGAHPGFKCLHPVSKAETPLGKLPEAFLRAPESARFTASGDPSVSTASAAWRKECPFFSGTWSQSVWPEYIPVFSSLRPEHRHCRDWPLLHHQ